MTLLDAYALIAFLLGGRARADVRIILRERDAAATRTNLIEALDVSHRTHRVPIDRARETLEPLLDEAIALVPLDRAVAIRAAELRVRHHHGSACPISLADSVLVASAGPGDRIATPDPDVQRVAAAEKIETAVLPGGR